MAVIVPATVQQFGDTTNESIQNIFVMRRNAKEQMSEIGKYYNVVTTSSYIEKDSSILGTSKAKFIGENASVIYDAPLQGNDKSYTQKKYGDALKISDQLWRFGLEFRKITSVTESIVDSMYEKAQDDAADNLNNSYATSYTDDDGQTVTTSGGNSVALFSNAQTREDGGTNGNNIVYDATTYNMDFAYDALKALRRTAAAVLTGRGQKTNIKPDTLVCKYGSSVQSAYEELMGALSRNMIPGGNENDGAAKVGLPKLITLDYLDNDAYWFAFDSSMKNDKYGLQWKWNKQPTLDAPEYDYDTDLYKRKAIMFYDRGFNSWRGWFGSKGDGSTP